MAAETIQLLSDAQLAVLVGAIGTATAGVVGIVRWSVNRYTTALEKSDARYGALVEKSDARYEAMRDRGDDAAQAVLLGLQRVEGKLDWTLKETSGVYAVPNLPTGNPGDEEPTPPARPLNPITGRTPRMGGVYSTPSNERTVVRPSTKGER